MNVIERTFNLKLKQIVWDFQKDDKNRVWFVGIHSYLIETEARITIPMI